VAACRNSRGVYSLHAGLKQVPKTCLGHPPGARQVALMDRFGTVRFLRRIEAEYHLDDFAPVGAFFFGHQQPQIDCEMLLVIGIDTLRVRRPILKWRFSHCDLPPKDQSNVLGIHLPRIFAIFAPRNTYAAMHGAHHVARQNGKLGSYQGQ
jgi:hypothetical protein